MDKRKKDDEGSGGGEGVVGDVRRIGVEEEIVWLGNVRCCERWWCRVLYCLVYVVERCCSGTKSDGRCVCEDVRELERMDKEVGDKAEKCVGVRERTRRRDESEREPRGC